ncbi:hypothetical protein [Arenibacter palladensis]|uniref:hypothetical protein n=1 Tax=Arenibacter palladensis TaxID=237373 RepID=UPI0026E25408|nr:hypothetical protein [Arenibacter palladensis]MDO6603202.1 hypothetical protein [Arenibacter palladensis]
MKNFGKLFYASLFFVSCSMSLLAVNTGHGNCCSNTITELVDEVYKSPIGTWEYTVADVPYEYSAGVLIITKEKNEYKVLVKVNNNTLTASDVKVNDDKVNFSVYIEGGKVQVSLQVKDDILNGNANSSEGSFSLKGKKK